MNITEKQSLSFGQTYGTLQNTGVYDFLKKAEKGNKFPLFLKQKPLRFWTDLWLQSKKTKVKASTYIRYRNLIEHHIDPYLGDFKMNSIRLKTADAYVSYLLHCGRLDKTGGLSAKTVEDILSILKDVFRLAQNYGVVRNSWVGHLSVRKEETAIRVLTHQEEKALLSVLLHNTDSYKLGVLIAMYSGIRIGELCALQWKDVSLTEKVMKIDKTMQRLQKEKTDTVFKTQLLVSSPKSFSANRVIPLPDFLVKKMEPFAAAPNAFILSNSCRSVVEPRTMQNKIHLYLKECHIQGASFHTLRHTFATRCVELGFDIKTLSEILGHSSVKITLDRYVHTSLEQKRQNMQKIVI